MNARTVHGRGVFCSIVTMLVMAGTMVLVGCGTFGPPDPNIEPNKPKVGALPVGLYYGAGFTTGKCEARGKVKIKSEATGEEKTLPYGFTGLASGTCRTSILFGSLNPGWWHISVAYGDSGTYAGDCRKEVIAGLDNRNSIDIGIDFPVPACP